MRTSFDIFFAGGQALTPTIALCVFSDISHDIRFETSPDFRYLIRADRLNPGSLSLPVARPSEAMPIVSDADSYGNS